MFKTLYDVERAYAGGISTTERHRIIHQEFERASAAVHPTLLSRYQAAPGFGEDAFFWNWHLLVQAMPAEFKMLEIGVYKGRVIAVVDALATAAGKSATVTGLTPLSGAAADKYSTYDDVNYGEAILNTFDTLGADKNHLNIIKGFSTDAAAITTAQNLGPYDILFIDGCHDYPVVCHDIRTFSKMVKPGGYLVMDDASSLLEQPYGQFLGHMDVGLAVRACLDEAPEWTHLFAVGHNRVWRKQV